MSPTDLIIPAVLGLFAWYLGAIASALRHWLTAGDWRSAPPCIDFVEADTPAAGGGWVKRILS
jgi:hypothetical protein